MTNNRNDDDNFQSRASASASKIISQSTLNPAEILAQSLTADQPKIDSAVKSYMSLCAARSWTSTEMDNTASAAASSRMVEMKNNKAKCYFASSSSSDPRVDSLKCARALLKAINSITIPTDDDGSSQNAKNDEEKNATNKVEDDAATKLERDVVRIVWNGLVKSGNKPSKILGKQSLIHAYPHIMKRVEKSATTTTTNEKKDSGISSDDDNLLPVGVDKECSILFFQEFGRLLTEQQQQNSSTLKNDEEDCDSALLWDVDGGKAELARRRDRRVKRGKAVKAHEEELKKVRQVSSSKANDVSSLTIEEIAENEDDDGDDEG